MDILYDVGINDINIKSMINMCPNLINLSKSEIENKVNILESIGCNKKHIKNIIISNPFYLDKITEDILKLIKRLKELGFDTLNILFDSNPYILNLDIYEIDNYVDSETRQGKSVEQIVDNLSSNPILFNEM